MSLKKRFGQNVQSIRRQKQLTQTELADLSGLSVGFIRTIEQGVYAPSFDSLEAIAQALNVSVKDLFDFD